MHKIKISNIVNEELNIPQIRGTLETIHWKM